MFMHYRLRGNQLAAALATSIGTTALLAMPGAAFTFSSSEAMFKLDNFSTLPLDVAAVHTTQTQALAPDGLVKSNADAKALFLADALNPSSSQANGSSSSVVNGSGNSYSGLAQSVAQVVGYSFLVTGGETFSFNFTNTLNLKTSIDQPGIETASAIGVLGLGLYDAADPNNLMLLDFLTIAGSLDSDTSNTLTVDHSAGIAFTAKQTALDSVADGKQASASASVQGALSHFFANSTALLVVEYGSNQATAAVPEPSSILAPLVCIGLLGLRFGRKPKLH